MCRHFSKATLMFAALLATLTFTVLVVPVKAQSAGGSPPYYDTSREVTLSGTVARVLARPVAGMIMGSHILLTTVSGTVDASLGRWGLQGKGKDAFSVVPGQQVQVTGIMKTLKDRDVFVTRAVKVNGKVYTLRNEHGIPISPQARERAAEKGESL